MKFITYAENADQLETLNKFLKLYKISNENVEIIVTTKNLSRVSETTPEELSLIIAKNQKLKLPLVLEWDVLKQDSLFKKCVEEFRALPLHEFKAVRVQDPGALNFVKENYSWLKVQLILENGNHNLIGLNRWKEFLGDQLDRLILSNELSKNHLAHYAEHLTTGIEVLAFGRILLFYSPRLLLSPLSKKPDLEKNIEAFGTSEESPHSGFPLIENQHGTFMFNVKDLCLLEQIGELEAMGIEAVRFDLRFDDSFEHVSLLIRHFKSLATSDEIKRLKSQNPRPLIRGFYNINKTDVLFSKLKNKRIERQDENYLGEIVDVERDFSMALLMKSKSKTLSQGDKIRVVTPEGKVKVLKIEKMKKPSGDQLLLAGMNDIVLLPFIRGIVGKSQVYLTN